MDTLNQQSSPQSAPEQIPAPPKPALNSKILFIALIVFIVIMSGLTAYLLAGRTKPISKPPPSISPTTSQPFPTIDPTANWKTYTNSKYEYSVKYPSDWDIQDNDIASKPEIVTFIKEPSRKGIDMHSRAVSITVESNPRKNIPTIEWYKTEWAKQIPAGINFDNVRFEETTFQDLPALKVSNTIFFARGIYMFRVEWGVIDFGNADPKLVKLVEQTFDQILATFKFFPASPMDRNQKQIVELVLSDLSKTLNIPIEKITVLNIEEKVWPDSCLGLPTPELCAQVLTSGYRITLEALGKTYIYRTDKNKHFSFEGP